MEIASQHLLDGQLIEGWFDIKKGNKVSYRTVLLQALRGTTASDETSRVACIQCCGSGLDPDSMGSLDPYPDPDSQSGKCWVFSLRAEGFSCSLDVLYGGIGISKLQFLGKR